MKKSRTIAISVLLAIAIALSIVAGVMLYRENRLNNLQRTALSELEENAGEYDEQKIVLYDTTASEASMLAEKFNATLRITSDGKFATLTLTDGTTVEDIYSERTNRKYLSDMSLDYYAKTSETDASSEKLTSSPNYTVSDTYYSLQSYINYLNVGDAWTTTRGSGITVAIIDSGIDTDHPEFAGRISVYSYNATEDKIVKDYKTSSGDYDWSLIEDEQGHGTSVAGVVAASMDGSGITGITPEVNLIIIKAACDSGGQFTNVSDLVFGIYYAIEMDVDVINMSFGSSVNSYASATKLAVDSDIICVAAAGNDATASLTYPAADENVIGVGALAEDSWELASYSNYGENINVVAPGTTYTTKIDGEYDTATGTSLAAPIVTGAIALYLTQNKYSEFSDVTENLYASCYDLGSLGEDWTYGYGALDINALVCEDRGTVTFDMLTDELDDIEQIFVVGHTLQNLPEPERTYAVFDGWYYDIECTEELNWYSDVFTSDLTLYAKWVTEDDGVPYTYVTLDDGTIEIRSYTGKRRYITIPDTIDGKIVSSIGDEAFAGQTRFRQVNLPSGLTNIGRSAFYNCNNLLKIEIPEGVTTIGEGAFYNNVRLSSVAFAGNSRLTTVGESAFAYSGITRFELPSGLSDIDGSAFYGATSLKAITVASGNACFIADGGVLFNYAKDTIIAYPAGLGGEYVVPDGVTSIANKAFAYAKITAIDWSGVTAIGNSAFTNSSLKNLVIPDCVTSLGVGAFSCNYYLETVSLGTGLTSIPDLCFSSCVMLKSVTIPKGIQTIGAGVYGSSFAGCTVLSEVIFESGGNLTLIGMCAFKSIAITEITIPASVETIGGQAFGDNYNLTSVTFESGSNLQTIGSGTFFCDFRLTKINLPESLQTIGEQAFYGNSSLAEIILPESIREIGDYAFIKSGLTEVTLPAGLTSLGVGAFASCHSLTAINVADGNAVYVSIDGVVYDTALTTIVEYPAGNSATAYTIESTVTTVGEAAFYGSWNLETVNLPSSLVTISDYGFFDCEFMTEYNLNEGLTYIEAYAFSQNSSLTSLAMPDSVYQISNYAFASDYSLASVTFNDTSTLPRISYAAFAYCGITSLRVPASVSTMAQGAFIGCSRLTSVTFAENSKLSYIAAYVFNGCSNLKTITFESGTALTSIQAHGLEGMTSLTSIDFGDAQLTNIDNYSFRYCESLTTLTIPDGVTYIGRFAFYGCKSLETVTIPASIDFIGRYAFYAYGVNSVNLYFKGENLPDNLQEYWDYGIGGYYLGVAEVITVDDWSYSVTSGGNVSIIEYLGSETVIDLTAVDFGVDGDIISIGGYAFYNTDVTSVTLPDTLTSIQRYAFAYSKITEITIPDSVTFIGQYAFFYTPLTSVTFGEDSQLKTIEQYAFYYTRSLTSITLPASLATLGSYAFYYSGITQVNFANGIALTEIPKYAFADSGLTSVTLPDSVTYINDNAFRNCLSLQTVTFGDGDDIEIHSNAFYNTGLTYVYIPANIRYIGEYAFVGLTSLNAFEVAEDNANYASYDGMLYNKDISKLIAAPGAIEGTITLPESLEVIGYGAFENTSAEAVIFDDNCNLLALGYRSFYNAQNLISVYIPASVVSIDFYAFAMCTNLTTVTFAEDSRLTGVYEGAFYGCISLENIILPDSIIEISDYAFYGCSSLTNLPITDTSELMGIYDYAFAYTGINELVVPDTVSDISDYAFRGSKLKSVYIPEACASTMVIGIGAFADCEELAEITVPFIGAYFNDDQITWFGYIFGAGGYAANNTYVPESLKTVTITEGITFIGKYAFYELENLEAINIPYSVTTLYDYALYGTTAVYELTNTITVSGNYASIDNQFGVGISGTLSLAEGTTSVYLEDCTNLEGVVTPGTMTSIDGRSFYGCSSLSSVQLSDKTESIGGYAFTDCISLTDIELPCSVTSIGFCSFQNCSNLKSVSLADGLLSIGTSSFSLCVSLTEIDIPDSVTEIGVRAFQSCYNLAKVTMPDSLTSLSGYAFYYCTGLTDIVIPSGVTSISEYAFYSCTSLATLTFAEGSRLTSIDNCAFFKCESLMSAIIPDSVTSIGENAFSGCTYMSNLTLPDSLTSIGASAFGSCSNLTNIVLPSGVTSIGTSAFRNCNSLWQVTNYSDLELTIGSTDNGYIAYSAKIIIDKDGNSVYQIEGSDFMCIDTADGFRFTYEYGEYSLIAYIGAEDTVTLPEDINGSTYTIYYMRGVKNVIIPDTFTTIDSRAFYECPTLRSIIIPDSVTTIGTYAFYSCSNLTDITFGENSSLNNIGYSAFYSCSSLTSIAVPDGVTAIGMTVFANCSSLTSVELSENVTAIGSDAFYCCSSLTDINIPDGVATIASYAFYNCSSLTDITIPGGITSITTAAFNGCKSLTQIEIPASVKTIGNYAFYNCVSLASVTFEEGSKLTSIGNYAFSCNSFAENHSLTKIIIPCGVTSIGTCAFYNCSGLTSVIFEEGSQLLSIGDSAFSGCNLTSIEIPEKVNSIGTNALSNSGIAEIIIADDNEYFSAENGVLYNKDKTKIIWISDGLTSVTIANTVTDIESAFSGCTNLVSVYFEEGCSLTTIGSLAFYGCTNLLSITIPACVTNISIEAFEDCTSLAKVTFEEGSRLAAIGLYAFENCVSLKTITIPASVTDILSRAFYGCSSLVSVNFEADSRLENIDYGAFYNCVNLTSIAIPGSVTSIGEDVFFGCNSLSTVTFGDGIQLETISYRAFYNCVNLTSISIPSSVISIEGSAFSGCTDLSSVTFGEDSQLTEILNYAFSACYGLTSIEIPDGVTDIGVMAFNMCLNLTSVTIPDSVTSIGSYAFYACRKLSSVSIPDGVTCIEDYTFYDCKNLTSVTLPCNLTSIGSFAFSFCSNLTAIELPGSVTSIDSWAFSGCESLWYITNNSDLPLEIGSDEYGYIARYAKLIVDKDGNKTYIDDDSGYVYLDTTDGFCFICENGSYKLIAYLGAEDTITLPSDINGNSYEVYYLRGVHNVIIPDSMTAIDGYAFYGCTSLSSVTIADSVTKIGAYAFYGCSNLTKVAFAENGNLDVIGEQAFCNCSSLTSVALPAGVTSIEMDAFRGCSNLVSVEIPDNVTNIEGSVFYNCSSLTSIEIPSGILVLYSSVFYNCSSLTSVILPDGLLTISNDAFCNCTSLYDIEIPDSVVSISADVFYNTAYYNDESNWVNGSLYIGNCLIKVDASVKYAGKEGVTCIAEDAFEECYSLVQVTIGGEHYKVLSDLTNLETLIITDMPSYDVTGGISKYFGLAGANIPSTLKNVVIKSTAEVKDSQIFKYLTGITIYVEALQIDVMWDDDYPDWNNSNTVIYGGKFITAEFYDGGGNLLSSSIYKTTQVVRQPYISDYVSGNCRYVFIGWDTDGDGLADVIPAMSSSDIIATALFSVEYRCVTEGHNWISEITTEATCTSDGVMTHTCEYCGETYTETIAATGHAEGEAVKENYVAATCVSDGSYDLVVYCSVCGEEISRTTIIIPATGHDYVAAVTEPTCTEQGYTTYTCSHCGDSYIADYTEATGHSWNDGEITTEATCTSDGVMTYTCEHCGETYTETIPAKGHTEGEEVIENYIAPTCQTAGFYSVVVYCTDCGEQLSVRIVEMSYGDHTSGEAVTENYVAATCTADGSYELVYYCTVCGEEISRTTITLPATGHTSGEAVTENYVAATCTTAGSYELVYCCTVCGEEISRTAVTIPASGHTSGETVIENYVAASCTSNGSYDLVVYCTVCGEELSRTTEVIPATGHNYIISDTVDPTCTEQGYTVYTCQYCGDTYTSDYAEALGHSWNSGEITTAATCTTDGVLTYTCEHCGETHTELIAATGHTASDWIVDSEAGAGVEGHRHIECTECGEILYEETIAALPGDSGTTDSSTTDSSSADSSTTDSSTADSGGDDSDADSGSGTQSGSSSGDNKKKGGGCGAVIDSDGGGSGDLMIIAVSMVALCAVYALIRRYKKKG